MLMRTDFGAALQVGATTLVHCLGLRSPELQAELLARFAGENKPKLKPATVKPRSLIGYGLVSTWTSSCSDVTNSSRTDVTQGSVNGTVRSDVTVKPNNGKTFCDVSKFSPNEENPELELNNSTSNKSFHEPSTSINIDENVIEEKIEQVEVTLNGFYLTEHVEFKHNDLINVENHGRINGRLEAATNNEWNREDRMKRIDENGGGYESQISLKNCNNWNVDLGGTCSVINNQADDHLNGSNIPQVNEINNSTDNCEACVENQTKIIQQITEHVGVADHDVLVPLHQSATLNLDVFSQQTSTGSEVMSTTENEVSCTSPTGSEVSCTSPTGSDISYQFHLHELDDEPELEERQNALAPLTSSFPGSGSGHDSDSVICGNTGTIRGIRNRVRAGIATFLQPKGNAKKYTQLESGLVVTYSTTMGIVRDTSHRCSRVRTILRTLLVQFEERDVFMQPRYQEELKERLPGMAQPCLPQVFVCGQYLGDATIIEELNEIGELRKLLRPFKRHSGESSCDRCGGYKLVPCVSCNGSKKSVHRNNFTQEFLALRCAQCDHNGLVRCDHCLP